VNAPMNRYVIEHRRIAYGKREHPLIEVVGEVLASTAKEADRIARQRYQLTPCEELLHVRRAS
jgi:hypothetical protein